MGAPMRSTGPPSSRCAAGGGTAMAGRLNEPLRTAETAIWADMAMSSENHHLVELSVSKGPKFENSDNLHKGFPGGSRKRGSMRAYLADLAAKSSQVGAM